MVGVVLMCGADVRPRRLWLSLSGSMSQLGIKKRARRFPAMPVAWRACFIGPVGSSHLHARGSGRQLEVNLVGALRELHGAISKRSVVVRTTEMMAIHLRAMAYRQRRKKTTKRETAFTSMRALVLCWL